MMRWLRILALYVFIVLLSCIVVFAAEKKSGQKKGGSYKDSTTGMEFVFVKGGCYQMGDTFGDGMDNEKPVHEVCVDDFYIGKFEVTQGQWKALFGSNSNWGTSLTGYEGGKTVIKAIIGSPSSFGDCGDNCPVEMVTWDHAQKFISELNSRSGENKYRLPTEAEWEYAARSGGRSERYSGENDIDRVHGIKKTQGAGRILWVRNTLMDWDCMT